MAFKPVLQALVLADHVYIDGSTGKKVIAGTFNRLAAEAFPTEFAIPKYAFLSMTDVYHQVELTLRYVDLSDNHILFEIKGLGIQSQDPLDTVELVVELPRLPMPHEGAYAFEAHAGGEMLGSLRIQVTRRSEEHSSDSD